MRPRTSALARWLRVGVLLAATVAAGACALAYVRHLRAFPGTDIHHLAWRTPDDAAQALWAAHLEAAGLEVSPVMDRDYFHSIYFREPGGVLFEIATDPPGFTVDEPVERLGETLNLPAWLEGQRREIEARLPPLRLPPR